MTAFAELSQTLSDREALTSYLEGLESTAAGKVEVAANRIKLRKYS